MIFNGTMTLEHCSDGPFVYQNIHTLGHKARFVEQHIEYVKRAAEECFGADAVPAISAIRLRKEITDLLAINKVSPNASTKVELRVDTEGNYSLHCGDATIYAGYSLRSIRPAAICVHSNMPINNYPTSASLATRQMCDAVARSKGYRAAVIAESDGGVAIEPAMPVFIVKEYDVFTPAGCASVEFSLAERAIRQAGYRLTQRRVLTADINDADEIFWVDWQGVTSALQIGQRPCMDIIANRVADIMEKIKTL
ncbi:MAG: hypothetical protein E7131_01705 [Rikenellaceae bacterium]|nr:hypothetical protein [Rikenellaceae bacterium]